MGHVSLLGHQLDDNCFLLHPVKFLFTSHSAIFDTTYSEILPELLNK